MSLIDDFKARFPEFDETAVDNAFPALEGLYPCFYNYEYGVNHCRDQAILLLLAHLFVVETNGLSDGNMSQYGANKEISSASVGSVSVSYAGTGASTDRKEYFKTTKYGQQFLLVTSSNRGGLIV
jgi:hypothetical protein